MADAILEEMVHAIEVGPHHADRVFLVEPGSRAACRIDDEVEVGVAFQRLREVHREKTEPVGL